MTTISLKLPDGLLAQIEREAKVKHVTKSQVVRESLEKALNQNQAASHGSCYDLARDLAGSVKGLPRDIAVNPRYMDDFGR